MTAEEQAVVLQRISQWSFLVTLGICAVSLFGWVFDLLIIASINPAYIPIAPSTAVCFSILSASLFVHVTRPASTLCRAIAAIGASMTFLISFILLLAFFFKATFEVELMGIKAPVFFDKIPSGHMSPYTAAAFLTAAAGALFSLYAGKEKQWTMHISSVIATNVVLFGFVVILGYLHGTPLLYGGDIIPVALPTAAAFEFVGLGLITAAGPAALPIRFFAGPSVRVRLMRSFLPVIVAFVLIDGLVYKTAFSRAGNPALLSALIALLSILIIGVIISRISKAIGGEIDHAHDELKRADKEREQLISELREALSEVKTLSGLLPTCASCKKIRDDEGYWHEIEHYITQHTDAKFTHGLCLECAKKLYPEHYKKSWEETNEMRKLD